MLIFVPTPLGNLSDITYRALDVFSSTQLFLCEDTRVTKRLLTLLKERYGLQLLDNVRFVSFHEHNGKERLMQYGPLFKETTCAYVSDAGMPVISDPGQILVAYCQENNIDYDVLPGASAVTVAYAASGFTGGRFCFHAFLPHKGKERQRELSRIMQNVYDTVLYESPHRLLQLLEEIVTHDEARMIFAVKEISKTHQRYFKDKAKHLLRRLYSENIRGEWCVVIEGKAKENDGTTLSFDDLYTMDLPPKVKAKLLAKVTNESVKYWYTRLTER